MNDAHHFGEEAVELRAIERKAGDKHGDADQKNNDERNQRTLCRWHSVRHWRRRIPVQTRVSTSVKVTRAVAVTHLSAAPDPVLR